MLQGALAAGSQIPTQAVSSSPNHQLSYNQVPN